MKKYLMLVPMILAMSASAFAFETAPVLVPAEELAMELGLPTDSITDPSVAAMSEDRPDHGPRREVTCYARNRRGERFSARGRNPDRVQAEAMERCYRAPSRHCFEEGCRYDR